MNIVGPAYALGERVPLEEAVSGADAAERIATLREHGFDRCSVSAEPPSALAARAVSTLLGATGVAASDIDAVVYATCSYTSEANREKAVRSALPALADKPFHTVWLGESGNLAHVLRLARGLLATGVGTVLCVVADKVPDRPGEYRAMPNAVTVNGDGAAACLLSARLPGSYTLDGIGQVAAPVMATYVKGEGLRKHLAIMSGIRGCVNALYEATNTTGEDYRWLVTNNYSQRTLGEFADMARIPRVFTGNVARNGHVFTADGLVNLADLTDGLDQGERVLALSTGPLTWGALGFTRSPSVT
ncbi:hypothetical protein ACTG9Q_09600 [Actinokineospora sp. 24-640]